MSFLKKVLILNFSAATFFALDRLTKWLAFNKKFSLPENFLFSLFKIKFQKNTTILGLEISRSLLLLVITIIIIALFFLLIRNYQKKEFFLILILTLILIGALSNLIDRLIYGGVIDFINFSSSTFNLADCFIVSGVSFWAIKEFIFPFFSKKGSFR